MTPLDEEEEDPGSDVPGGVAVAEEAEPGSAGSGVVVVVVGEAGPGSAVSGVVVVAFGGGGVHNGRACAGQGAAVARLDAAALTHVSFTAPAKSHQLQRSHKRM